MLKVFQQKFIFKKNLLNQLILQRKLSRSERPDLLRKIKRTRARLNALSFMKREDLSLVAGTLIIGGIKIFLFQGKTDGQEAESNSELEENSSTILEFPDGERILI